MSFASSESVDDVATFLDREGCKAWCCHILSLGCMPFIKRVKDSKSILMTTNCYALMTVLDAASAGLISNF
jgi:hypothetical protein